MSKIEIPHEKNSYKVYYPLNSKLSILDHILDLITLILNNLFIP